MSDQLLTLIVAIAGGSGAALITGLLTRPKTHADAKASNTAADVAVSGDSRAWAQFWADAATAAESKRVETEKRAEEAEQKAEHAEQMAERGERRTTLLIQYVRALSEEIVTLGGHVPAPPPGLDLPPLDTP